MQKILYTDFEGIDTIIGEMLQSTEIKKAITRNNLYAFWKKAVGEKFAQNSRPFSMMGGGVMVIACKNSIVAQELLMRKSQILTKFLPYIESLKIKVKDLKFDPKKWES